MLMHGIVRCLCNKLVLHKSSQGSQDSAPRAGIKCYRESRGRFTAEVAAAHVPEACSLCAHVFPCSDCELECMVVFTNKGCVHTNKRGKIK